MPRRGTTKASAAPSFRLSTPLLEVLAVRPREAWRMLGISASSGWKWIRLGKIRVIRVGPNVTMIEMAELRRFLAAHATEPPPELPDAAD